MSVSARSIFTKAFDRYLFDVEFIDIPTAENIETLQERIRSIGDKCAGFIFEPLILGSGGMLMYDPHYLDQLLGTCSEYGILILADEVMTGFGRTGKNFAMQHVNTQPDIICLSKGITGGTMAMGVTTCTEAIYQAFLSEDKLKTLFHGHSYTANPITCATAMASLDIFLSEPCQASIQRITNRHREFGQSIASHPTIKNIRQHGTIIAFDVRTDDGDSYTSKVRDSLYAFFLKRKVLLRPLGNTLYIMPPYCITNEELDKVYTAIRELLETLA
jgi:adenosylmethionine-8-amino-7-oxononanoate aminotransferase